MWVRILLPLPISKVTIWGSPLKAKMRKFINYLKESYKELTQKVTWPSWSKLQSSAVLVLVATLVLAIVIFLMDFTFQHLMELVYSL